MTRVVEKPDRVHVFTRSIEWTILKGFSNGRGPCYISDIREATRPYRVILRDTAGPHTLNDPRYGGLFGFGFVAADPPPNPDIESFWRWAWEITTRLDGSKIGFGVRDPDVTVTGRDTVRASCRLVLRSDTLADLVWRYRFGHDDIARCLLTVEPRPFPGWIKEPKVVSNGMTGYRQLIVSDSTGVLSKHDLMRLSDPRRHTLQIAAPTRELFEFTRPGWQPYIVRLDDGLKAWADAADRDPSMSDLFSPAYCLNDGRLWHRSEVARWAIDDIAGLLHHGWEGGAGAPDCWNTFRPWPTQPIAIRCGAGVGTRPLLPAMPRSRPADR